jgi:hypothetical protein
VTAAETKARLITCNAQDFVEIPGIEIEATSGS